MTDALAIFGFARERIARGERAVLVTLTAVTGSSARAPGAHMAVAADGSSAGSFSGGCVEAAVVAEAVEVLVEGRPRSVRFGAGSPYIDIRLPCGGGIDIFFLPDPPLPEIDRAMTLLEARRPVLLDQSEQGGLIVAPARASDQTGWDRTGRFRVRHDPRLRLIVLGHGAEPGALLRVARGFGADALLLSPDAAVVEEAIALGYPSQQLMIVGRSDALHADPWSAVVFLFHDHDWELDLLVQALEQSPFFIGAMGSRRTQAERCARLAELGIAPELIRRITGPIGLVHATRDPATLAISIMAQIVDQRARTGDQARRNDVELGSPHH